MRHWEELARYERGGFTIIIDKTWEDCHPGDCFDDKEYDIEDMVKKIDHGDLDWFIARARVLVDGLELADACLGGLLYENARDFVGDDMCEDLIADASHDALERVRALSSKFLMLSLRNSEVDSLAV